MHPRVFVSHASEDKDRFVLEFAARLRERGIDAWLDKWEMLPGDSFVDKIFEEGIKHATAVIVVLSKFSVEKPWVREELNAGFVKRIDNGSKLIPVVIDDCEIPAVLTSTLWERILDVSSYDDSLERIVSSVFGITDKPPLGVPPAYTESFIAHIGGLSNIDSLVLRKSCEHALKTGEALIEPGAVLVSGEFPAVPDEELRDSLEMLDREGYIKIVRLIGMDFCPFKVTTYGFQQYAQACIPDYQVRIASVVSAVVNEGLRDNHAITERLKENELMVDHILFVLRDSGHIRLAELIGGVSRVIDVSPALKRGLRGS